jgi:hypothetical protein
MDRCGPGCEARDGDEEMRSSAVLFLVLAGCTSSGIVHMDRDTYMVSERGPTVGFSPPIRQTASVYRQANEFCARQNKQVETLKLDQQDSGLGRPANATLQFRCIHEATQ